jgi:hypothetical protein
MTNYPHLVNIAWGVVEKFLRDWRCEPYRWSREIDIQTEITHRISSVYKIIGSDTVLGNYDNAVVGFERNQRWNRVCCEPKISYTFSDGKRYFCYPDIVVWDEIKNPNSPPNPDVSNWPMLWVCEIKLDGKKERDWDVEKMGYLLSQGDARYGCWLNVFRKRAKTGNGILWDKSAKDGRIWICDVMLPKLGQDGQL